MARQQRDWEDLASYDPWGSILRDPTRSEPWERDEFLATGERDAERALANARAHGLPSARRRALDFGCGIGRLTQALCDRFDEVLGLDISPTMVRLAREIVAAENVRFSVGDEEALAALPAGEYDFVVSLLVLQHLPSSGDVERVLSLLTQRLARGGALVVQVPDRLPVRRRVQSRRRAYAALRGLGVPARVLIGRLRLDPIRTVALPARRVAALVEAAGGRVVSSESDDASGPHVPSRRYVITRD